MSAPPVQATTVQVTHDDGRVDLADPSVIAGSRYSNAELAPVPVQRRTWTTYNFVALWMGMAHNIPSYLLASGLIVLGMNWLQAFLTITIANLLVLVPMLLNSHAGTKYGIPFPVFSRAFYGVRGANLAALLRAFVACGWFGIQTWIGGQAIYVIMGRLAGSGWSNATTFAGQHWTMWLSFAVFWILQMALIWRGINALRRFENWAAPLVTLAFTALLAWILIKAGGIGPLLHQKGTLGWGPKFWPVFWPSLMAMIAFWATLSLNMPDFTRFGRGQRQQAIGQLLGLPTTMSYIAIVSILVTSGTEVVYHAQIWDPVTLTTKFSSPVVVVIGLLMVVLATMCVNVAANVVSPSYDFSNASPRLISFRFGGLITGVLGIAIQPWRLVSDPHLYIFVWLDFYGGILGAVAGVLIAGYWVRSRTRLGLAALYEPGGRYWYSGGWNWRAVAATVIGGVLAVGGAWSAPGAGPFPAQGLIPLLKPLYSYSWVVGLGAGFVIYLLLSLVARPSAQHAATARTLAAG
ncbi:MAG: NCS1 family nucleobase:cation symporter-1 [Streptosporangiaceae bacterium]|nr:NCS1 family nucleobase:cation symporter-1 [Streptosporangiaceae bacterium]MBV9855591.1 NCS1 family nucleobase:cation symporter-1 [Streptosporangiaceae bacterium]